MLSTESFSLKRQAQLHWVASPGHHDIPGIFQVYLYDAGTRQLRGLPVSETVGSSKSGSTILRGAGEYYLDVNAANCSWRVQVEPN